MLSYMLAGFGICCYFLWVFYQRKSLSNNQFYITLAVWLIFIFEICRYQFPTRLTLPQPYRHYQFQFEHAMIVIYGWEVLRYVGSKMGSPKARNY